MQMTLNHLLSRISKWERYRVETTPQEPATQLRLSKREFLLDDDSCQHCPGMLQTLEDLFSQQVRYVVACLIPIGIIILLN